MMKTVHAVEPMLAAQAVLTADIVGGKDLDFEAAFQAGVGHSSSVKAISSLNEKLRETRSPWTKRRLRAERDVWLERLREEMDLSVAAIRGHDLPSSGGATETVVAVVRETSYPQP